ncbi:hypothetical protein GE061_009522 [Apolygus lucorum]|uniref:Uncharacterized protein n=1 Tax=Apolygus lucorum TaxID=248454 RepID=A0A8S9Y1Y4_APOLU|nr:hypothetical protein GE061_009522 [Apolygus lucorum]
MRLRTNTPKKQQRIPLYLKFSQRTQDPMFGDCCVRRQLMPVACCGMPISTQVADKSASGFLVNTKGCRILDLITEDIRGQQVNKQDRKDCEDAVPRLVRASSAHIYVDSEAAANYTDDSFVCCYRPFRRAEFLGGVENTHKANQTHPFDVDRILIYDYTCYEFNHSIEMTFEFVKVTCTVEETGKEIFREFFAFPLNPYKRGDREFMNLFDSNNLNVLMIGFEATSRFDFSRRMPRTMEFLENHDVISLQGYSTVGNDSYSNILPVLTGYSEGGLSEVCRPSNRSVFNNCTFLWDLFKKQGYVTALSEEHPNGPFHLLERGFTKQPVDFYTRPFDLLVKYVGVEKNCTTSKLLNNHIKSFLEKMEHQLNFAFFWNNRSNELPNQQVLDDEFLDLLISVESLGLFNKTVLILMSDRGLKQNEFLWTLEGHLEERLPFVHFVFPSWFKKKYKVAMNNMKMNQERLTTPFDLHETLKDILDLSKLADEVLIANTTQTNGTGASLFRQISTTRTCKDGGILDEFCACHTSDAVPRDSQTLREAAQSIVDHVNSLLSNHSQCPTLHLANIVDGKLQEVIRVDKNSKFQKMPPRYAFQDYVVTLETSPGGALFEATARHRRNSDFSVIGEVNRLNNDWSESECISVKNLKYYCYCL